MVADELIARLKTVSGASAVFDAETLPEKHTAGAAPYLLLQEISTAPSHAIDGTLYATEQRWQVSVIGRVLGNVRTVAQAVIASLHGYTSDSIKRCDYTSWPGTIREGEGASREFHAPVDFTIFQQET